MAAPVAARVAVRRLARAAVSAARGPGDLVVRPAGRRRGVLRTAATSPAATRTSSAAAAAAARRVGRSAASRPGDRAPRRCGAATDAPCGFDYPPVPPPSRCGRHASRARPRATRSTPTSRRACSSSASRRSSSSCPSTRPSRSATRGSTARTRSSRRWPLEGSTSCNALYSYVASSMLQLGVKALLIELSID